SVKRMKIGYARKSTHLQDVAHQVDELTKAGCEQIYQDQTSRSGPKRDKKGAPELENCLKALREGDTLVVWALDRLGGSLGQVITLLDDLKKRGITFIAIKDRIDTNAPVIGEIYTHLMAIFSSFERKRTARTVLTGMCYSVGSVMRQGSSSLTRLTGQSAMTSRTWRR
ncbi:recombinase family protein, partial [Escherichia coli]